MNHHLILTKTKDNRTSIVFNGITVLTHADTEFVHIVLNRLRATIGQAPLLRVKPYTLKPKNIEIGRYAAQFLGVKVHQQIAQILPFLPGVSNINGYLAVQFTQGKTKATTYLKDPPIVGVQVNHKRFKAMLGNKYLGTFDTQLEAALAHDHAACATFGEAHGPLNFPLHTHALLKGVIHIQVTR